MSKIEFVEAFQDRTKKLSIQIIFLFRRLPDTDEAKLIGRQLVRSATSTASNYRAACRARSNKEFFSIMSIVIEEADETVFWLELLTETEIYKVDDSIMNEAVEIMKVVSKSRKTAKTD